MRSDRGTGVKTGRKGGTGEREGEEEAEGPRRQAKEITKKTRRTKKAAGMEHREGDVAFIARSAGNLFTPGNLA